MSLMRWNRILLSKLICPLKIKYEGKKNYEHTVYGLCVNICVYISTCLKWSWTWLYNLRDFVGNCHIFCCKIYDHGICFRKEYSLLIFSFSLSPLQKRIMYWISYLACHITNIKMKYGNFQNSNFLD